MRLGLTSPETARRGNAASVAQRAERLGYESFWLGELWGQNSFTLLGEAASRTDSIHLGTGIVNVFSRTPAVLAMGANSLQSISDGRALLGVGVSSPTAIEGLHGLSFERPIKRTHETVELIQQLLSSEDRVNYDGDMVQSKGFPGLDRDIPIANAALGSANRRLTGQLCDIWMPNNVPISIMGEYFDVVTQSAERNGRNPTDIKCVPWIHTAVSKDTNEARNAVRNTIAYYVGSSDGYKTAVGDAYEEAQEIADRWRSNERDEARELVTDEMVSDLGCAGTPENVREQLRALSEREFIDYPIVAIPDSLSSTQSRKTIVAVAPEQF